MITSSFGHSSEFHLPFSQGSSTGNSQFWPEIIRSGLSLLPDTGTQELLLASVIEEAAIQIQQFSQSSQFFEGMQEAFGPGINLGFAQFIVQDFVNGTVRPGVEVLAAEELGAHGAFGANTIYLADDLLNPNQTRFTQAVSIFQEEVGHYFDMLLNPSGDAPGDEGEIFAEWVSGNSLTAQELAALQVQDDHAVLFLGDRVIPVEHAEGDLSVGSDGILIVSGTPDETVQISFNWTEREASFDNEIGVYVVAPDGSVDGIAPTNPGYSAALFSSSSRQVLFSSPARGGGPGVLRQLTFAAEDQLAFYLIQDSTSNTFEAFNINNTEGNLPLTFFSITAANPDGINHVLTDSVAEGVFNLAWEDLTGGGDRDFNDVVFTVQVGDGTTSFGTGPLPGMALNLPGAEGQRVQTTVTATARDGNFASEFGFFVVDDEDGRIGDLSPGDAGYVTAALGDASRVIRLGSEQTEVIGQLPGNRWVGSFLIQDSSLAHFLDQNPENQIGQEPLAFFSFVAANPDQYDHLRTQQIGENRYELKWEDLTNGGDRDFNDLTIEVEFGESSGSILSIEDLVVNEAAGEAIIPVSLSGPSVELVTVDFATTDGTASQETDYQFLNGTLTFAPGVTSQTIVVPLVVDDEDEENETFFLNLMNAVGGTIAPDNNSAQITIEDSEDDSSQPQPQPQISIADLTVNEGSGEAQFTVSLSERSDQNVSVNFTTTEGSALEDQDFQPTIGLLNFDPGEIVQTIVVPLVDDQIDEPNEQFTVELSNPVNGTISDAEAIGIIQDNDPLPELSIADVTVVEPDIETEVAQVTVNLSRPSSETITIDFATVNGTALVGQDYQEATGSISFAPGETEQTLEILINGDILDELDETFTIELSNVSGASIVEGEGLITITDDDDAPTLSISNVEVAESGTEALFTVSLSSASSQIVTVDFTTVDDTALAGEDYQAVADTLTFTTGTTIQTISVPILDDEIDEQDETFTIELSNIVNATLSTTQATGTILDDDEPAPSMIGGTVFNDENGDGILNDGENGQAGVTVFLDLNQNGFLTNGEPSQVTDSAGQYRFEDVAPGNYMVWEEVPDGFEQTTPGTVFSNVTVEVGTAVDNVDFGNQEFVFPTGTGEIRGFTWEDLNANGVRDTQLVRGGNPDIVFVVDVSGSADFNFAGSNIEDFNGDGVANTRLDAEIASFIALNNQLIQQGLGQAAEVGIVVFSGFAAQADMNLVTDEVQLVATPLADEDDNGISDVEDVLRSLRSGAFGVGNNTGTNFEVALQRTEETLNSIGTPVGSGNVIFLSDGEVNRGSSVSDEIERLSALGVNISAFGVGSNASLSDLQTIDSDATVFTTAEELVDVLSNLGEGGTELTEAGLPSFTLYLDLNQNAHLDPNEPTQVTDAEGNYSFTGLAAGTYDVRQIQQPGFRQTFPLQNASSGGDGFADVVLEYFAAGNSPSPLAEPYGSTGGRPIGTTENGFFTIEPVDPSVILGAPPPSPVVSTNPEVDWLALPQGSFVTVGFTDEQVIDGPGDDIFIRSFDPEDAANETADVFVSADGTNFEFLGTVNEQGLVSLDLATIGFTEPVVAVRVVGNDNLGSSPGFDLISVEVLPESSAAPDFYRIEVAEDEVVEGINFGNKENTGEIRGFKWEDLDADGVFDEDESPIAGVTIYLDLNENGQIDLNEPSQQTDSSGFYRFRDLEAGTYTVLEVTPLNFEQTFPVGAGIGAGEGFADTVLDYFDSGAGPVPGPYGEVVGVTGQLSPVDLDVVLGDEPELGADYLSLPTGSFVTVGFTDEVIVDGLGDDIFIEEIGSAREEAEVFVSSNNLDFTLLGIADGGSVTSFDLATIGFIDPVRAIKIVGLDNRGSSPGFDVVNVQVLAQSISPPLPHRIELSPGEIVENINFGNRVIGQGNGSIRGLKWEDIDGDGVRDIDSSTIELINNSTPAYYNDNLGDLYPGNSEDLLAQFFFPPNDISNFFDGQFTQPPDLSAINPLEDWLIDPEEALQNTFWSSLQTIPPTWNINEENAIIYEIDGGTSGISEVIGSFGVDNGLFVWVNGEYKFGANGPGVFMPGEYQVDLGHLNPGKNYIQVLRQDYGAANGYDVEIIGTRNPEPGLAGISIYLDTNNNSVFDAGEPIQITAIDDPSTPDIDETGQYAFTGLPVGTYIVREIVSEGLRQTFPTDFYQVDLVEGEVVEDLNFGNSRNQAPVIASIPREQALAGILYEYQLQAVDEDGDEITFALEEGTDGALLDDTTGLFTFTPADTTIGQAFSFEVIARDLFGGEDRQSFSLTVLDPSNLPPEITSTPVVTARIGATYEYQVLANDPEGTTVQFSLMAGAPDGLTIDSDTGLITWVPQADQVEPFSIGVIATDADGVQGTQTFELTVQEVSTENISPVVELGFSSNLIDVGEDLSLQIRATDDGTITNLELTANGTPLDLTPGTIASGVINEATIQFQQSGLIDIVGTATDNDGNVGTLSLQVRVIDPSDTEAPFVELDLTQFTPEISVSPDGEVTTTGGTLITSLTDIIGTVTDDNLEFFRLELAPVNLLGSNVAADDPDYIVIAEGNTNQEDVVIGQIDPLLFANDTYLLRLIAGDFSGNINARAINVALSTVTKPGQFTQEFVDLSIPVAGIPIDITRTYNSFEANQVGDFGFGWSLGAQDPRIQESVPVTDGIAGFFTATPFKIGDTVSLTNPEGRRVTFRFEPVVSNASLLGAVWSPRFVAEDGVFDTLEVDNTPLTIGSDGSAGLFLFGFAYNPSTYRLTTRDGTVYTYDQFDGLQSVTDRNGNVLTYTDNGIVSSTGVSVEFRRDSQGRITEIIDPEGNSIQYNYDANGDLIEVVDPTNNATQLFYERDDLPHYLTNFIDPAGRSGTRGEYDDNGQLVKLIDAEGNALELNFDGATSTQTLQDPFGNDLLFVFDDRGNIIREVDALGGVTERTFDDDNNLLSETDSLGNTTSFTYDDRGNVLTQTDALGNTIAFTYNQFSQVLTTSDPLGFTTTNEYDDKGNLIQTTNAEGNSTTFVYDDIGNPQQVTDASGNVTTFIYTSLGLINSVTDAEGNVTTFTYDNVGNITSLTTPGGFTTSFGYNNQNLLTSATDPLGNVSANEYDAAGQRSATVDALGRRTEFTYNSRSLVETITYPDGTVETFAYDALDRQISATDRNGNTTQFQYDPLDRLIGVVDALNNQTTYERDLNGNLVAQTDAEARTTRFTYDELDRIATTTLPLGQISTNSYDAVGNLIQTNDFNGDILNYEYDGLQQLTEISLADSTVLETFTYTPTDLIATAQDERGLTQFNYDGLDRLASRIDPDGTAISYLYDADSNLTSLTTPSGTVQYAYDALGRLDLVTDRENGITDYDYDAVGNLTRTVFANGVIETREYDVNDRIELLTTINGSNNTLASYAYTFDNVGNRLSEADNTGRVTIYSYDDLYRVTETDVTDSTLGDETTIYTYDAVGNIQTRTDNNGTTTYTYDNNDRLLQEETNGQVITYTYDDAGNRIDKRINGIIVEVYDWNIQGELASAAITEDDTTTNVEYQYNSDGIRVSQTVDGEEIRFLIDATQQEFAQVIEEYSPGGIIQVVYTQGNDLISQTRGTEQGFYHTDSLGSIRLLTDVSGNVANTYLYDPYGSVLNQVEVQQNSYKFTGEQFDNELANYYLRARYYNPAIGRFASRDPFVGIIERPLSLNDYLYAEGNPINAVDPSGEVVSVETVLLVGRIVSFGLSVYTIVDVGIYCETGSSPLLSLPPTSLLDFIAILHKQVCDQFRRISDILSDVNNRFRNQGNRS